MKTDLTNKQLRKIDYLVDRHVFGITVLEYTEETADDLVPNNTILRFKQDVPKYSTDFLAAWNISEELNYLWFEVGRENCCGVRYDCRLYNRHDLEDKVNITAKTPALAVCLAVLKAVGVDVREELKDGSSWN